MQLKKNDVNNTVAAIWFKKIKITDKFVWTLIQLCTATTQI
jgi:hypothetical protein